MVIILFSPATHFSLVMDRCIPARTGHWTCMVLLWKLDSSSSDVAQLCTVFSCLSKAVVSYMSVIVFVRVISQGSDSQRTSFDLHKFGHGMLYTELQSQGF